VSGKAEVERFLSREAVSLAQWGGIAMVFTGIMVLAAP